VGKIFRGIPSGTFAIAAVIAYSSPVWADGINAEAPAPDDSGFTLLSNATDVTHWGLGAGVGIKQSPYQGDGAKVSPYPLFYFDDKWVHVLGTGADLKIGKWHDVSFALRGSYALGDGYDGSDAPILNGMQDRKAAFWYGPAIEWHTNFGTLSGDYLLGGNKGERAKIAFGKSLNYGSFSIEPHVGVEWLSGKYVDYYYGVRLSEARAGRPEYTGTATWNTSVGTRVSYKFTAHQTAIVDIGVSHLGTGISDSPIAGKRFMPEVRLGYLYQFR
jgi:MipA family protein